jgi:hypothetical protein
VGGLPKGNNKKINRGKNSDNVKKVTEDFKNPIDI